MNSEDEGKNVLAGVITDLVKRVETFEGNVTKQVATAEQSMQLRQDNFEQKLFDLFVDLRRDIHASYSKLELDSRDHAQVHVAEKLERENDKLIRAQRQFTLNLILAGIVLLLIVGFIVIGVIVYLKK